MDIIGRQNLRQMWDDLAELYGDKTALIVENIQGMACEYSYRELNEEINRTANLFHTLKIAKGDKVALHLNNCVEFFFCWFGLAKIGAVMVPVNANLLRNESAYIISQCDASIVVTSAEFYPMYQDIQQQADQPLRQVMLINLPAGTTTLPPEVLDFHALKRLQPDHLLHC